MEPLLSVFLSLPLPLPSSLALSLSLSLYIYIYINDRINRGRAAMTKLNSILWDRDVTPKTKTHIYHAIVKSTITYVAETWCLKAKKAAKLNSTEIDFWRRSARISRKDKIRNTVIKQKNECNKVSFSRY